MLDLSAENKALCFADSTLKPLYIFIYYFQEEYLAPNGGHWQYFTTVDDAIVLESAEITEGVLEGDNFELGSFCCPSMKVQWRNNGISYKDMVAIPVQKIGDEYIAYFDGYISNEEISQDGQTVTAEINSFLTQRLDVSESTLKSLVDTLKSYNGSTFYNMLQNALGQVAGIGIKGMETSELTKRFANANTTITLNNNTLPDKITVSELLKQAGEFLGAHIVVKEKRVVNIDDMINYQPSTMPIIDFIRFSNLNTALQSQTKSLPSGYKRLEYIQTNGSQYINTGYIPTKNTKIEMEFYNSAKSLNAIFGARTSANVNDFNLFASLYNLNEFVFDTSGVRKIISQKALRNQKISAQVDKITINDITTSTGVANLNCEYPIYLFSINTAGSFYTNCALCKLYYFKIYENNVLQRDMIPCVRTNDNKAGLYDLISGAFYVDENGGNFIAPNPIETYTLPYYINLSVDKTNSLSIDKISVLTKTGDQLNYTQWFEDKAYNTYEIKDNIFFEALSTQSWEQCEKAVWEVSSYLDTLKLYYSDLQCIYPLFSESSDYLIIKSKNQNLLPSEYLILDNITLSNKNINSGVYIDTEIIPDSDNIEIEIDFSLLGGLSYIFSADARDIFYDTLSMYANGNSLTSDIGYYSSGTQQTAFNIPYVPINQKIKLNIKCGNKKYEYKGTFNGNGSYYDLDNTIYTKAEPLILGSATGTEVNYKLYHFAYSQGGNKMCDMYPCMRKSDGVVGVYDIVRNTFKSVQGNAHPEYETADTVIPILSTITSGIHSMRADILCKATNTNKN